MLLIEYPKCSTCKKAEKWLDDNGIAYEKRDIIKDHPNKEELKTWIARSGLNVKNFFNTSGLKYRELNLKDKLDSMSLEEKIELLATDGMLVKRPLLISDDTILVGFKEKQWFEKVEK